MAATPVMRNSGTAAYLYCVVRSVRRPSTKGLPPGLPGASAASARKVTDSLWLMAAEVPLEVYGPSELEPRLRDLDWVSRAAVAHEAVIEHVAARRGTVVIPAKLFTMFTTLDKATQDVAGRRAAINRVMKRISGCEEWGVRITRRRVAAPAATAHGARTVSGAAFLAERKASRDAAANARAAAAGVAANVFRRLARLARDASRRESRQEPGTNPPVLDAAFLVPAAARARFKVEARRQAATCASAGADMTLTGPWPAYNFVGTPS